MRRCRTFEYVNSAQCYCALRPYRAHMDYAHLNPRKHGLVERVVDWPYSTFHRLVAAGVYPHDWADDANTTPLPTTIDPHVGRISRRRNAPMSNVPNTSIRRNAIAPYVPVSAESTTSTANLFVCIVKQWLRRSGRFADKI